MKITIEIPKEFEQDFKKVDYLKLVDTQFEDSMNRIKIDLENHSLLSGQYELETIDMIIKAFKNATTVKPDGWDVVKSIKHIVCDGTIDENAIKYQLIEKIIVDLELAGIEEK